MVNVVYDLPFFVHIVFSVVMLCRAEIAGCLSEEGSQIEMCHTNA